MLKIVHASFASVDELFRYKFIGQNLDPFPGYSNDQWGIKAHNRPWIESAGDFKADQKIIEVGGAYSSLPRYLAQKYRLKAWVGDDFGEYSSDSMWTRWGDPKQLQQKFPETKYVYKPFGIFSDEYPNNYFDRIFSVSTLEHIPEHLRLDVFKDMNRCMAPGGTQIHAIDIGIPNVKRGLFQALGDKYNILKKMSYRFTSEVSGWIDIMKRSGIEVSVEIPNTIQMFNRKTLAESYDVVYNLYAPVNSPKDYDPTASLLVIIQKSN